jgi:putative redox protein
MGVKVLARRRSGYTHDVEIEGGHALVIDEPAADGGADEGPSPTRTLGAALAACTAITTEMYAERKGWELGALEVEVGIEYDGPAPSAFEVTLRCPGDLDDEQLDRLVTIAGKCPVHRALSRETTVTVTDHIERS